MKDPKLQIALEAVDRFTGPFKKVERAMDRLTGSTGVRALRREFNAVGVAAGRLGTRIGVMAAGLGAFTGALAVGGVAAVQQFVDAAGKLDDTAKRLNVNVVALQKLNYAAEQTGATAEQLENAFGIFNRTIGEAAQGSKTQANVFRGLGIALRDANGVMKPSEVLFGEVADAFTRITDTQKQAAIGQKLFGRGALTLLPMLREGSAGIRRYGEEAEWAGMIMSEQAVDGAQGLGDKFLLLGKIVTGIKQRFAAGLLPVVQQLTDRFLAWWDVNRKLVASGVEKWAGRLGDAFLRIAEGLPGFLERANKVFDAVGGWKPILAVAGAAVTAFTLGPIVQLTAALASLGAVLLTTPIGWFAAAVVGIGLLAYKIYTQWEPIKTFFADLWGGIVEAFDGAISGIRTRFDAFIAWIRAKFAAITNLVPNWARGWMGGGGGGVERGSRGNRSTEPAPAPAAAQPAPMTPLAAVQHQVAVGGRVKIEVENPGGRTRLRELKSENREIPLDFYAGEQRIPPSWP